jgi:K+-transporting ATPase KdpF subunit
MKSGNVMPVLLLLVVPDASVAGNNAEINQASYIIGSVIALFILGYLVYSLFKPDKF